MNKIIKVVIAGVISLMATSVYAATIDVATLNLTGSYNATGGSDLSDATTISLNSVNATGASGDFTLTINGFPPPSGTGTSASLDAFTAVANFVSIGGWNFGIASLNVIDQTQNLLSLDGTGVLTGNNFDATGATWSFSAESATSYSMTISSNGIPAVPVPAAVWLFGTGLIGLVGVARRKA